MSSTSLGCAIPARPGRTASATIKINIFLLAVIECSNLQQLPQIHHAENAVICHKFPTVFCEHAIFEKFSSKSCYLQTVLVENVQ